MSALPFPLQGRACLARVRNVSQKPQKDAENRRMAGAVPPCPPVRPIGRSSIRVRKGIHVIRCQERNVNNQNNKKKFVSISVIRVRILICVIRSQERNENNVNNQNNKKKFVSISVIRVRILICGIRCQERNVNNVNNQNNKKNFVFISVIRVRKV